MQGIEWRLGSTKEPFWGLFEEIVHISRTAHRLDASVCGIWLSTTSSGLLHSSNPVFKLLPRIIDRVKAHQLFLVAQICITPSAFFVDVCQVCIEQFAVPNFNFPLVGHLEELSVLNCPLDVGRRMWR